MSCLLFEATLITAAAAVAGSPAPPASVAAERQEVTAGVSASLLSPLSVSVDTGARVVALCELVPDVPRVLSVNGTLLNVIPRAEALVVNATPSVDAPLLNDASAAAAAATGSVSVSVSEICIVSEADITVLATADGEALRTGNGGYLRLLDDEEEPLND